MGRAQRTRVVEADRRDDRELRELTSCLAYIPVLLSSPFIVERKLVTCTQLDSSSFLISAPFRVDLEVHSIFQLCGQGSADISRYRHPLCSNDKEHKGMGQPELSRFAQATSAFRTTYSACKVHSGQLERHSEGFPSLFSVSQPKDDRGISLHEATRLSV